MERNICANGTEILCIISAAIYQSDNPINHLVYSHISVSHRINIKGAGMHQWYMNFGQQCSINVVFGINF